MNSAESSIHAGSTSNLESSNAIYAEFWQAPPRFWKPRVRELEEDEMEAIMVSPATIEPSHSNSLQLTLFPTERRCLFILTYIPFSSQAHNTVTNTTLIFAQMELGRTTKPNLSLRMLANAAQFRPRP